jgi:hypothetical protein
MVDLSHLKIPVYMGINDQPRSPTQSLAGNGSHIIKTINDIIDGFNPPTETWTDYQIFYVDTIGGSDSNDGASESAPLKTWAGLIAVVQAKKIPSFISVCIKGGFTETLDFSSLWGGFLGLWANGLPTIFLRGWISTGGSWQFLGGGELLKINPLSPIKVYLAQCVFIAADAPFLIRNNNGFVHFGWDCTFSGGSDNYDSLLHFENCQLIWLNPYGESLTFNGSDSSIWAGIVANGKTQLWINGATFNDMEYAVTAYSDSTVINHNVRCTYNNVDYYWEIWEGSRLYSAFPDTLIPVHLSLADGGQVNSSHTQTFFFPSLSASTITPLYRVRYSQRLQYVRVDGALTGATFQFQIDGSDVGEPLDEMAREFYFDAASDTKMYQGAEIGLVVTGNPTNVSLQLELMEF